MLSFTLDHAEPSRVVGQIDDWVVSLATMVRPGKVVDAAVDHLKRERRERLVQFFSHGISQVNQDDIQQPGRPQLELDAVLRTNPEVGQAQQAFRDVVCIFDPPALPIQGHEWRMCTR